MLFNEQSSQISPFPKVYHYTQNQAVMIINTWQNWNGFNVTIFSIILYLFSCLYIMKYHTKKERPAHSVFFLNALPFCSNIAPCFSDSNVIIKVKTFGFISLDSNDCNITENQH